MSKDSSFPKESLTLRSRHAPWVRQLNCVKLHCQDLLGDNPERLFLGGAKIHPQIQITGHLTENLHIFLK